MEVLRKFRQTALALPRVPRVPQCHSATCLSAGVVGKREKKEKGPPEVSRGYVLHRLFQLVRCPLPITAPFILSALEHPLHRPLLVFLLRTSMASSRRFFIDASFLLDIP